MIDLFWVAEDRQPFSLTDKGDFPRLTYWPANWKSLSTWGLWSLAEATLAGSLFYMDFLIDGQWAGQRERVHAMCRRLVNDGYPRRCRDTEENRAWFHAFLVEVGDEVENQC